MSKIPAASPTKDTARDAWLREWAEVVSPDSALSLAHTAVKDIGLRLYISPHDYENYSILKRIDKIKRRIRTVSYLQG